MSKTIQLISIARKQLGLQEEETWRAKLVNLVGESSLRAMTETQLTKVLTVLKNEGFKSTVSRRPNGKAKLSGVYAGKLQALWIAGWNLGVFRERDDAALVAFVKRQTGLDAVQFLRAAADARKAVEAIKAILAREGGVNWKDQITGEPDGLKIAWAQFAKMGLPHQDFWPVVNDLIGEPDRNRDLTPAQWIKVMNHFGERIRKVGA